MRAAAVIASLLLATSAFADAVSVGLRPGIIGKQLPAIEIHILEPIAGFHLKLKRSDGAPVDVKGGGAPGVTRVIDLDQPEGKFHYEGELLVNLPDAEVLTMPMEFDTQLFGPLRLEIDKDKDVDLAKRTIRFKLSRPAGKAKVTVVSEGGEKVFDQELPFNGEPAGTSLEVSWPETKDLVLKISVVGYDQMGMYTGIELFPYEVYIPHEEIVFDTGKWNIRTDQDTKLSAPLEDLKKRIARARPWAPVKLYVIGHTDTVGDAKNNRMLSLNRARAISQYFRKSGVDIPIFYEGYGEEALSVPTPDETAEEKNRSVDYVLSVEPLQFEHPPWKPRWQKL